MKRSWAYCSSAIGALALTTAAAQAQSNNSSRAPSKGEVSTELSGSSDQDNALERNAADIVVTGSRLMTNGNNLPTPVTTVSTEALLRNTPTSVPDALKKLPAFALSRGTAVQGDTTDNATGAYLNLRGIGIQRNLVLLDGHRVPPTSYTGAVDTNILPQMLLQRVDVVTGGASAVYGSDAVSGVINFVLNTKFEGLSVQAQRGISTFGDAPSWRAGAAYGTTFAGDRGHVMASFEHYDQNGFLKEARKSGRAVYALAGSGTTADPYRLITNARNSAIGFNGSIFSGPLAGQQFVAPGVVGPFQHGITQGAGLESGGDGFYGKNSSATADVTTDQAFGRADYAITDDINAYAQGFWARSKNFNYFYPFLFNPVVVVGNDNAFLPAALRSALGGPFVFSRVFDDAEHRLAIKNETASWQAAAGLTGSLGKLKWDIFYQHAQSTSRNEGLGFGVAANLFASLDAADEGLLRSGVANGNIVCRANVTNPGSHPGCVPINPFGTSPATQDAALDYIYGSIYNRPRFPLDNVSASISGTAFDNWAGPVRFAISGEYRRMGMDITTGVPGSALADCTGIRFNCVQGTTTYYYGGGGITPVSAHQTVKEAAFETELPLLANSAIGNASLNGAVRYTDYSTSGSEITWKVGGDWSPLDGLRFRGTRSRDIRAPSLYDLFQPATLANSGYQDVHTGFNGLVQTQTVGNSNLAPEKADTTTFGLVFAPSFIPRLSISIDYFRIKMKDVISAVDGRSQIVQRLCEAANGTGPYCDLYDRPLPFSDRTLANAPTRVRSTQLNGATLKTWGIDTEINYSVPIGAENRLTLRGLAGYQPQLTTVLIPGTDPIKNGGVASIQQGGGISKLRLTGFVSFATPHWSIDVQERWRSSLRQDANRAVVYDIPKVPAVAYTDITLTAFIGTDRDKSIFLSVQNLFNKNPPPYVVSAFSGTPAFQYPSIVGDDVIGRYFSVGARFKF
jgi:outer membrane receptor protein involved in Fe transport